MAFPVNVQQQAEIDATKIFFDTLRSEGIDVNTANTTAPAIITAAIRMLIGSTRSFAAGTEVIFSSIATKATRSSPFVSSSFLSCLFVSIGVIIPNPPR